MSCVVLSACAAGPWAAAQPDSPPVTIQQPRVTLAGEIELPRLIDLCAAQTRVRIDYDPAVVKGSVTLRLDEAVTGEELWSLTNQLLAHRGFTTVIAPGGTTVSVVKTTDAAPWAQVADVPPGGATPAGFGSLVLEPTNLRAKELAESVRPLLTKGVGAVSTLGDSGLLLISDFTPRLVEIRSLMGRLDRADEPFAVEVAPLTHLPAANVVATLTQLLARSSEGGGISIAGEVIAAPGGDGVIIVAPRDAVGTWRDVIARLDNRELAHTRTYTPRVFPAKDVAALITEIAGMDGDRVSLRARVIVDDLTGSVIVTATTTQHAQVAALMERLDAAQGATLPMRSFPIRNRPVREMVSTLSTLIDAGVMESEVTDSARDAGRDAVRAGGDQRSLRNLATGATAPGIPGPAVPATPPPRAANTSTLRLTADEATNTLIAIGEPRQLSQLESLLQMLDVRQPQVMLEAVLVSMSDTDALNLGVELEKLGNIGDAAYKIASLFGLSTVTNGVRSAADAQGFSGVVLNPGEFSVVVQALQAINKGRSLSNPRVLVTNNEQARFSSVLEQPFVRTDTTNSTATSSFGGSDSAGTTISVKPQIAQGDHLVLTYSINLSSFVGTPAAAGLPPPKQQNSVDSVATIPDGHVVVVGGLELESESTSTSQIPLLGDVPLVGELFKNRSTGTNRTRFFVFIKATVMRSRGFEDLKYISGVAADKAGIDDGLPQVRPRVIR